MWFDVRLGIIKSRLNVILVTSYYAIAGARREKSINLKLFRVKLCNGNSVWKWVCVYIASSASECFFFCAIRFTAQPRRWSAETMENSHAKWKVLEAKSGGNRYFSRCHRVPARGGFGNSLMCARGELGILDTISQPILMLKHLFCLSRILFRW